MARTMTGTVATRKTARAARPADIIADRPFAPKVEALAGFGLPAEDIAQVLDIDAAELADTYAKELASGAIKANARVAESLYRKALGEGREAVTAAIFWLKTRARWKEVHVTEHAGSLDNPIVITISPEDARL